MTWDEATKDRLRRFWSEGHSTKEIARRMGCSKNAIIGKSHRIGLPSRASPLGPQERTGFGSRTAWATPERVAVLQLCIPSYVPMTEIVTRLEALDGSEMPKPSAIGQYANRTLGLYRPHGFQRAIQRPPVYRGGGWKLKPKEVVMQLKVVEPKKKAAKQSQAVAVEPVSKADRRVVAARQTSFTGQSWCMATLPKPAPRVPGVCNWPLSCDAAAVGRFCADHVGLIGRRAA